MCPLVHCWENEVSAIAASAMRAAAQEVIHRHLSHLRRIRLEGRLNYFSTTIIKYIIKSGLQ